MVRRLAGLAVFDGFDGKFEEIFYGFGTVEVKAFLELNSVIG